MRPDARRPARRLVLWPLALALLAAAPAVAFAVAGKHERRAATTLYVSASGSGSSNCTQAQPCKTFDRAYRVARPGDLVLVGPGEYPEQEIRFDSTKSGTCDGYRVPADVSGCVTFRPAPGAAVRFTGEIVVLGNQVRLAGFDMGANGVSVNPASICRSPETTNVILDGMRGSQLTIDAASYVADLNGDWSGDRGGSGQSVLIHRCVDGEVEPNHIRLDHGYYHDMTQTEPGQHLQCVHIDPGDYVTIANSRFTNCAQYDVRISYVDRQRDNVSHFLIENNLFGATCSQQGSLCGNVAALEFDCSGLNGTSCDSNVIRFNTIDGYFHPGVEDGSPGFTNSVFYGNLLVSGDDEFHCKTYLAAKLVYRYNVFGTVAQQAGQAVPCGEGSVLADGQLVNPKAPAYDFRLASARVRAGDLVPSTVPGGYPARDYAGRSRPTRSPVAAGAFQWDTALIVPGRSIGGVRLGAREADVTQAYGDPLRRVSVRLPGGKTDVLTYRLHRGTLTVYLSGGTVVGVGTSSRYYTSASGLGVGLETQPVRSNPRATWIGCRRALRYPVGNVGVFVVPAGGRAGRTVAAVTMMRKSVGYDVCARPRR